MYIYMNFNDEFMLPLLLV